MFIPIANASTTPQGTGTITMNNGTTAVFRPVVNSTQALSTTGYTQGGFTMRSYSTSIAVPLNAATGLPYVPGAVLTGVPSGDSTLRIFAPGTSINSVTSDTTVHTTSKNRPNRRAKLKNLYFTN